MDTFYALLYHPHDLFRISHCHQDLKWAMQLQQHSLFLSTTILLPKVKTYLKKVEILKWSFYKLKPVNRYSHAVCILQT